jgi:drug/metabolite transporter (DMT)-like permease
VSLSGFLGVFCNQVLFLYGVKLTNATVASIVHLTLPLFAASLAIGFGMEQFRALTGVGIVLAVGGAMIMKGMDDSGSGGGGGGEEESMSNLGLFVIALGAFTSAVVGRCKLHSVAP